MRQKKSWFTVSDALVVLVVALLLPMGAVAASKYKVLRSFTGKNAVFPNGVFSFDGSGNLYGTTYFGGAHNGGTAFRVTPKAIGNWTEHVLHSFCQQNCGGYLPVTGLVFDTTGNL